MTSDAGRSRIEAYFARSTCKAKELLALPMSVVEEQAKELGVDAAGGAKDGGQKRDIL
jgi:hypothetical protein